MGNLNPDGQEQKINQLELENDQLETENLELEKELTELESKNEVLEKENAEIDNENDMLEKANSYLTKESKTKSIKIAKLASKVTLLTVILSLVIAYIFFTDVAPTIAIIDPTITDAYKSKYEDHRYIDEIGLTLEDPDKFETYSQKRTVDINGVPDNGRDNYAKWNLKPGCGPLAVINIIEYWDKNGYDNLVNSDKPETYQTIKKYIKSFPSGEGEGTYPKDILSGLKQYAIDRGYTNSTTDIEYQSNDLWDVLIRELQQNRPVAAAIKVLDGKDMNHMVVITGIREYVAANGNGISETKRYIVINDGWSATKEQSFAKFNQNYTALITFNPKN